MRTLCKANPACWFEPAALFSRSVLCHAVLIWVAVLTGRGAMGWLALRWLDRLTQVAPLVAHQTPTIFVCSFFWGLCHKVVDCLHQEGAYSLCCTFRNPDTSVTLCCFVVWLPPAYEHCLCRTVAAACWLMTEPEPSLQAAHCFLILVHLCSLFFQWRSPPLMVRLVGYYWCWPRRLFLSTP
jgi:hypothetical protein